MLRLFLIIVSMMGVCMALQAGEAAPTIWLVGDSTVAPSSKKRLPQAGWGEKFNLYCKDGAIVKNHAVGGRSTKSFIDEKRWEKVKKDLKSGDYVIIQFGHNDQKPDEARHTDPKNTYRDYLKLYINEAKAKGAHPILVTSVMRRIFKDGKLRDTLGGYPSAMKEVAKETGTPLIDLHQLSFDLLTRIGDEDSKKLYNYLKPGESPNFPDGRKDNSHFNLHGAQVIAGLIADDIIKQKIPLAKWLKPTRDVKEGSTATAK